MSTLPYHVNICSNRHDCKNEIINQAWRALKQSIKIYSLVHSLQTLLYKRKLLLKEFYSTIKGLLKKIIKSMAFFTYLATAIKFSLCFCNWLKNGKQDIYTLIFFIFVGNFGCLFESSSRVTEYAIFTYPKSLEGFWDLLEKLKLVKSIPLGREILYSISIGIALLIYKNKKEDMPQSYRSIMNLIFGKNV